MTEAQRFKFYMNLMIKVILMGESTIRRQYGLYQQGKLTVQEDDTIIRKKKITQEDIDIIVQLFEEDPTLKQDDAVQKFYEKVGKQISRRSISNSLQARGYKQFTQNIISSSDEDDKQKRINIAKFYIRDKEQFLFKTLFSNELIIESNPYNRPRVWIKSDQQNNLKDLAIKQKLAKFGTIFWVCVGYNYKSKLYVIPENVNQEVYIKIINEWYQDYCKEKTVINNLKERQIRFQHNFQQQYFIQNNALSQNTQTIFNNFENNDIQNILIWPIYSQDLNPIEYLWNDIQNNFNDFENVNSNNEFIQLIQKVWNEIPMKEINKKIMYMKQCGQYCLDVQGGQFNTINVK